MPLANRLASTVSAAREQPRYPLHARVCTRCWLVQVDEVATPNEIFDDYVYFSSYSETWLEHSRRYVDRVCRDIPLSKESLVLEVASNDGYLLQHFLPAGIPILGVEPAKNVASVAIERGVPTDTIFFGVDSARSIVASHGYPTLLIANNVLAHVPDLNDFVAGIAVALAGGGIASIEVPHLLRLLVGVQFDTIYHEHFSYFWLDTLRRIFAAHGLRVFDVEELATHGGSLRVWICHERNDRPTSPSVENVLAAEAEAGLQVEDTYRAFEQAVVDCRTAFLDFLRERERDGATVVAYGAAAKGATFLNYCGVGPNDIPAVADASPHKQGKYLPGSHIPIVAPTALASMRPDYLLILPWNIRREIEQDMSSIRDWGGRFVVAVPAISVSE